MDESIRTHTPKAQSPPAGLVAQLQLESKSMDGLWRLAGLFGSTALIFCLYWENLKHFTFVWSNDDNYSHGWLVAPLSLFFANQAAQKRVPPGVVRQSGAGLGLMLIMAGLIGRLISVFLPIGLVADGSMIACLAGVISLIYGRQTLIKYSFSVLFLLFMIPLPVALYTMLANPLQMIVSQFASSFMTLAGIPVLCEGNMMTLPGNIQMFVAEACSGMRQLTGFLALTAAVAYLSGRPIWYRLILILSAIPVAMIANIARVIVTGLIMYYVDPNYAKGAWHTVEGMALMIAGLALLQLEMLVLNSMMDLFAVNSATPQITDRDKTAAEQSFKPAVPGVQA